MSTGAMRMPVQPPPNAEDGAIIAAALGVCGVVVAAVVTAWANLRKLTVDGLNRREDKSDAKATALALTIPDHERNMQSNWESIAREQNVRIDDLKSSLGNALDRIAKLEALNDTSLQRARDAEARADIAEQRVKLLTIERDELLRQVGNTGLRQAIMADKLGEVGKAIVAIADTDTAVETALDSNDMKRPIHGADDSTEPTI